MARCDVIYLLANTAYDGVIAIVRAQKVFAASWSQSVCLQSVTAEIEPRFPSDAFFLFKSYQ